MNDKYIGVFDSGIGGLTILEQLKEVLPQEDFLYYADRGNAPYGNKSEEELLKITSHVVSKLKQRGCKLIVIACNTATTRCMQKLREEFSDIIFVGTVPAIKVACDNNYNNILIMATPATIKAERTKQLIKDNKKITQNIYLTACSGLATAIEKGNFKEINKILTNVFKDYQDKDISAIVLGCTHYPLIKEQIKVKMPHAILIDGSLGVAKEVKRQLQEHNLLKNSKNNGQIFFL